jgi:hypothetical protein
LPAALGGQLFHAAAANAPERFQAKWKPVRVKKTRQIKNLEPRFDSIETEKALAGQRDLGQFEPPGCHLAQDPAGLFVCRRRGQLQAMIGKIHISVAQGVALHD